ncbi:MAG: sugar nucleotide-binding protein [Patescibacteria group bacterium]|jgi:dTDP-4-dehydrorhamnose reductase
MKILIIGNGYIGSRCAQEWGNEAILSDKIINSTEDATDILEKFCPDAVLNAAGIVGKPNVDWCEANQLETIKGNTLLPLIIASACAQKNIYLLHIGSGCIFYGQSPEPKGWKETDFANPEVVYTKSKYAADLALMNLSNVGIARIRMPIDSLPYRGNLIDKLAAYKQVIDVENSVTVIEDMIKIFYQLLSKRARGIFHVTNPGSIKHKEILNLYRELVDPQHENSWINEADLVNLGLAVKKRSSNILQSKNLADLGIAMRPIKEALRQTLIDYAKNRRSDS